MEAKSVIASLIDEQWLPELQEGVALGQVFTRIDAQLAECMNHLKLPTGKRSQTPFEPRWVRETNEVLESLFASTDQALYFWSAVPPRTGTDLARSLNEDGRLLLYARALTEIRWRWIGKRDEILRAMHDLDRHVASRIDIDRLQDEMNEQWVNKELAKVRPSVQRLKDLGVQVTSAFIVEIVTRSAKALL